MRRLAYTVLGGIAIGCQTAAPPVAPSVVKMPPSKLEDRVIDGWTVEAPDQRDFPVSVGAGTFSAQYWRTGRKLVIMVADSHEETPTETLEPVEIALDPLASEPLPFRQRLDLSTGTINYFGKRTGKVEASLQSDPSRGTIRVFDALGGLPKEVNQPFPRGKVLRGTGDGKSLTLRIQEATDQAIEPAVWEKFWQTDIEISGPFEDQAAVRTWLWRLRTSVHPDNRVAPDPYGLTVGRYEGHVFWDADIWMFPALMLLDPGRANVIPRYRLRSLGVDKVTPFGWQTAYTGTDVTPPQSLRHRSSTASVAFAMHWANALGFVTNDQEQSVRAAARGFYDEIRDGAELKDVRSIDEYAEKVNNDLYTNVVANYAFNRWLGREEFRLPKDDRSFLNYDGDLERTYQQTAALLTVFPLQFPPAEAQARTLLERFAPKVNRAGPAMSESVNAVILARLGDAEGAYGSWRRGWTEFCAPPFLDYREFRADTDEEEITGEFHTGMAGSLNAVLYGFAGFRIDSKREPGAAWSTPLRNGYWLSLKPNLPPAWSRLTIRNFSVLGKTYTAVITADKVEVTESG